jgi:citrate lyase subunit beta/citryl-CoA lyase
MLIMPAHEPRFVEKAPLRGADAIVLDLEDAVPRSEKARARADARSAILHVGKGGADAFVRINNDDTRVEDISASVWPGLHGIFVPKIESKTEVLEIEGVIASLERERGIEPNSVRIALHVESPKGLLNLSEILSASQRAESLSLGADDYCLEMGVVPTDNGDELRFPLNMLCAYARAFSLAPLGIVGRVANISDMGLFRASALRAKAMGFVGAYCVHPDQVAILNEVFSPAIEETEHAKRVIAAFEDALERGRAAVRLEGFMVDTPVYKRALATLARARAVAERETLKTAAISRVEL